MSRHLQPPTVAVSALPLRGTTGAVISVYDDTLLVEITGPGGEMVDTIQVPGATLDTKCP